MKKLLALLLALVMVVALAACGVTTENAAAPAASSSRALEVSADLSGFTMGRTCTKRGVGIFIFSLKSPKQS